MNIKALRTLIANLPDDVSAEQFALIEADVEELLAEQRQADIAALGDYEQRCAKLREKLGMTAPPPIRPSISASADSSPLDETDAGMGVREPRDEGVSAQSFVDELASLRERTQEKRRRLG